MSVSTASPTPLYRVHDSAKAVQTCTGGWELSCLWPKKVSLLMECGHPSTKLIWSLTRCLWAGMALPWPDLSLSLLLGCGNIMISSPEDRPTNNGPSCLLRILLSKALCLTWVLWCERTIQGVSHSSTAVVTMEW